MLFVGHDTHSFSQSRRQLHHGTAILRKYISPGGNFEGATMPFDIEMFVWKNFESANGKAK